MSADNAISTRGGALSSHVSKNEIAWAYNLVIYRSNEQMPDKSSAFEVPRRIQRTVDVFCIDPTLERTNGGINGTEHHPGHFIPSKVLLGPSYIRNRSIGARPNKDPRIFVIAGRYLSRRSRWSTEDKLESLLVLQPLCTKDLEIFQRLIDMTGTTSQTCIPFQSGEYGFYLSNIADNKDVPQYPLYRQEYFAGTDHYQTSPLLPGGLQDGDFVVVQFFVALDTFMDGATWISLPAVKVTKLDQM